ncbi:MAG: NAD(P)H-binding protein [Candidatus Marinimicrobia bacterium]|nr:NAD(P)H-binding protein [Candidatus Neomarinimicrobiota bacterium]
MSQLRKAVVIGGTGATGQQLIKQLLENDKWGQITSIGRKPVLNGKRHDKLQDIVIESLYDLSSTKKLWKGNDVFFNCIGTTRKRAGSAKEFIKVEAGISMEAAKMASNAKISHASLVSASGANHNQWAKEWIHPLLYIRTIGQKEQTVIKNDFDRVSIFKPGMLIRLMENGNWIERIMKSKGLGLRVDDLALAMVYDAENKNGLSELDSSVVYLSNENIKSLITL